MGPKVKRPWENPTVEKNQPKARTERDNVTRSLPGNAVWMAGRRAVKLPQLSHLDAVTDNRVLARSRERQHTRATDHDGWK